MYQQQQRQMYLVQFQSPNAVVCGLQMVMMAHFQNQFKKSPAPQFSLTQSHLDSNCSVKSNNSRGELMMIRARWRDSFPYCSWKYVP